MNEVTLLIGGKSIKAQDERTFDRIDPMKRNVGNTIRSGVGCRR